MLQELYCQFIETKMHQHLVVEGDAKLYSLLQSLKFEYGQDLEWVIPYPGDWHMCQSPGYGITHSKSCMLMNYQAAMMKPYYDAGLKSMAEVAGYPVSAIQNCSQFKRTHHFILEAWEAVYRAMLTKYMDTQLPDTESNTGTSIQEIISKELQALHQTRDMDSSFRERFNKTILKINSLTESIYDSFNLFLQDMCTRDDTWKLWVQFILTDAMAYVTLFLSIRSGDWQLRMAGMKLMAPIFTAFDHPTYQKLLEH